MLSDLQMTRLYRYAVALSHDRAVAFELMQTTMEKCLRAAKIPGMKLNQSLFYKIMRNTYFDVAGKSDRLSPDESGDDVIDISSRNLNDVLIDRPEAEALLSWLDPAERELVFMHLVEGMTIDEISEVIERPRGALLSAVFRIKKKIKEKFPEHNPKDVL